MKVLTLLGVSVASALLLGTAGPTAQGCNPVGNVQFVCGQVGPEDLIPVPGGDWVLASGNRSDGALRAIRLISIRDKSTIVLFPTESPKLRPDRKTYDACPGPIDLSAREKSRWHGLYLQPGRNSVHTVYTVHHGTRESVEVFEFDTRAKPPTLTWIGCAVAPDPIGLNSVVALPEGGFVATNFSARGADPSVRTKMMAGENNGELWEWHTGTGWKIVPGSESSGPNGLEISKDGKWFYIGAWGSQAVVRLSRGQTPVKRDSAPVGFRVDNVRWAPDGSLLAAGQGGTAPSQTSNIARVDPNTLKVQELVRYPYNDVFTVGTVAIQIGKELWLGSTRGDRIAIFPASPSRSQ